jgi:hypothetical protein
MKAINKTLKTSLETDVRLIHNPNEHSRTWDNEGRDDLACRANQACDRAAKKIAAVIDQATVPKPWNRPRRDSFFG